LGYISIKLSIGSGASMLYNSSFDRGPYHVYLKLDAGTLSFYWWRSLYIVSRTSLMAVLTVRIGPATEIGSSGHVVSTFQCSRRGTPCSTHIVSQVRMVYTNPKKCTRMSTTKHTSYIHFDQPFSGSVFLCTLVAYTWPQ
jgi:hypothetical protein